MNRVINARKLKADAAEAAAKGKHKKALDHYLELERLEPKDGGWARRAGEMYRQLGRVSDGIAAFQRAADKYADSGLVAKASAVCQTILRMRPEDAGARARLDRLMPPRARPSVAAPARPAPAAEPRREDLLAEAMRVQPEPEPELRVRAGGSVPPPLPRDASAATRPAPIAKPAPAPNDVEDLEELDADLAEEDAEDLEIAAEPVDDLAEEAAVAGLELSAAPVEQPADDDDTFELRGESGDPALEREPGLDRDAVVEHALAAISLFSPFDAGEARALIARFEVVEIPAGARIVEAGMLADRLTVVVRGEVGVDGEPCSPAGVFGSSSLLARAPERATAHAVTRCAALVLPKASFREVIMTHPMLLAQLVED